MPRRWTGQPPEALLRIPHIARAYTREQLMHDHPEWDEAGHRIQSNYNQARGADIEFLPEPYFVFTRLKTTHGSSYDYDTHVPLIFMGAGIRAGSYDSPVEANDIVPTLAEILGLSKPDHAAGRVLSEMFNSQ